MSTKQDGLRYLKNRTKTLIDEVQNSRTKAWNELQKIQKDVESEYRKELKVDAKNCITKKTKNGEIVFYVSYSEIKDNRIIDAQKKYNKLSDYSIQDKEKQKIYEQSRAIENKILLHGMSDEIKKMLEGF